MEKLIRGILDFRKNILPERREQFAKLASGQAPDVLFITCSDSRVAPNWFASTDPGDLFVVRNVGNIVPPCGPSGETESDPSVGAAVEFSMTNLNITDIIVCGHSGCGAIHAISNGIDKIPSANLKKWLSSAEVALRSADFKLEASETLCAEDRLSQLSVLQQIEHLKTYPKIRERFQAGKLRLHAWWFDIASAGVHAFDDRIRRFVLIDTQMGNAILNALKTLGARPQAPASLTSALPSLDQNRS